MRRANRKTVQIYAATAGWIHDVTIALIDYTKAVEYGIRQNAQVSFAAETIRRAFTIHNDGSICYLQVLTNDARLRRTRELVLQGGREKGSKPGTRPSKKVLPPS
jgi:hypothetical protein